MSSAATRAPRPSSGSTGARRRLSGLFGLFDHFDPAVHGRFFRDQLRPDLLFDIGGDFRVLLQVIAGVVLALANPLALVAVPGAGFLDHIVKHADLDQLAFSRYAAAIHDLKFGLAEWRRHLVLDDLDTRLRTDHFLAVLDRAGAADIKAHRGVELQCVAASGRLRIAKHDPDLHADLVDEDDRGVRALDVAGQLAQRLRHQAGLQPHVMIAHFALDLGLRRQRRHRVDHDDIDRAGAHEHVGDLERLFAIVRLRYQQVIDLDAEFFRINRVERMLRIDERRGAAMCLCRGDDRKRQRGLARGLWPIDLDDAATRDAADAERNIQAQRAGRNRVYLIDCTRIAQAHNGALAKLFLDLAQRGGESFLAVVIHSGFLGDVMLYYFI